MIVSKVASNVESLKRADGGSADGSQLHVKTCISKRPAYHGFDQMCFKGIYSRVSSVTMKQGPETLQRQSLDQSLEFVRRRIL
jgi:hypothetical protein